MRVAIVDARPGMMVAQDLYSNDGLILLKAGTMLTDGIIKALKKRGVIAVEIGGQRAEALKPEQDKVDILSDKIRTEAEHTVRDIWNAVSRGNAINVDQVKITVEDMLQELLGKEFTFLKLVDIGAMDDYTFTHSVNVCVLSLILGIIKGYSETQLFELGIGSLLHDLGKIIIPPEIINKPGSLNNEELGIVHKHPAYGFSILCQEPRISIESSLVAYQHHERYDGSGYPHGLKGDQIHEYAQLVSIVDIYDALTSDRVYRSKISPYEAVEILVAMSGQELNSVYVKSFLENVELYPLGSIVELQNGLLGIVTAVNKKLPTRPLIALLAREGEQLVPVGEDVNLMQDTTLFIDRIIKIDKGLLARVAPSKD